MAIELHTWNTPNGRKISVALEEMGLPYNVHTVNISKGEQFENPRLPEDQPEQPHPGLIIDPEGPGESADQRVRVRRDPDLPRCKDR